MVSLLLAAIGAVVGLALDELAVRLAQPPEDGDGEQEVKAPSMHSEAGSLLLSRELSEQGWMRRLLIVGATAGLFAAIGARYDSPSHLAIVSAYACVLLLCAATDLLAYRVPNAVTYPAIVGALIIGAALPDAGIIEAIGGGLLAGGVLLLPALVTRGAGMGMGDVKLAAFVGLALGFENAVPALLVMALAGGAAAALLLVSGARRRGQPIPYAPFISAGGLAALLLRGTAFVDLA
ncbi:MAG: A24 family peptidase [Dehalococcoidia bacterium]|nr:A24 family peptidase [Dehalococcoidia bacterium]